MIMFGRVAVGVSDDIGDIDIERLGDGDCG
jgi:hypothetical protein